MDKYSNREIDIMFKEIKEMLIRIEAQTTKHNGRLSAFESWKSYATGAASVITLIVVPLLLYLVYIHIGK